MGSRTTLSMEGCARSGPASLLTSTVKRLKTIQTPVLVITTIVETLPVIQQSGVSQLTPKKNGNNVKISGAPSLSLHISR